MIKAINRFWQTHRQLNAKGVLSMNARNGDYIAAYNNRRHFRLVDDKLMSKKLAEQFHICVPSLYANLTEIRKIRPTLRQIMLQHQKVVIKPACGARGDGILLLDGIVTTDPNFQTVLLSEQSAANLATNTWRYRRHDGSIISEQELEQHCIHILAGLHSIGGQEDHVLCEYRVEYAEYFAPYTYLGAPDIRIIVFQGYPAMAMLRLPTKKSAGKANLHQGGIGVGLNISNGHAITGSYLNQLINFHPETGADLRQIQVQGWDQILEFAAKCFDMTQLGYLGVDLIVDQKLGPMMIELNARPGLQIQVANQAGLGNRLQQIQQHHSLFPEISLTEKIAWAKHAFAHAT